MDDVYAVLKTDSPDDDAVLTSEPIADPEQAQHLIEAQRGDV